MNGKYLGILIIFRQKYNQGKRNKRETKRNKEKQREKELKKRNIGMTNTFSTIEVNDKTKILSFGTSDHSARHEKIQESFRLMKLATKIEGRYIANTLIIFEQPFDTVEFTKLWDYFRMNNPISLAKFPSIAHIKARNKNGLEVDPKLYQTSCVFFEKFITTPHNHKMMNVVNNNPNLDNIFISCKDDDDSPFWIVHTANTVADQIDRLKSEMDLDASSSLLSVTILNLDGPFDQDPDREPNYDIVA